MNVKIEIDCTPAEARAFLGLPDVAPLNAHLVDEMKKRMDENLSQMRPEEIMRSWSAFGAQASEQFMSLMSGAAAAAAAADKPR